MTLDEFRRNKPLVEWAQKVQGHKFWSELMDALLSVHPKEELDPRKGVPETDRSIELGKIMGYDSYHNNLKLATKVVDDDATDFVQATFEPPKN